MTGFLKRKIINAVQSAPKQHDTAAPAAKMSTRAVGALETLFCAVISAELSSGVYQLESGTFSFCAAALPPRGHYDALFTAVSDALPEQSSEEWKTLFLRKNLYAQLLQGGTVSAAFPAPQTELSPAWFNVEAMPLSVTPNGQVRCMIFARMTNEAPQKQAAAPSSDVERVRAQKLLGGQQTCFFEYTVATDTLVFHRATGGDRTVARYISGIFDRCDWTIFHEDVHLAKQLITSEKYGSAEIRYRVGGEYNQPFHWHRMQCAPLEDAGAPTQIIGALTDIEDEVKLREENRQMTVQLGALLEVSVSRIYEIDTERGIISRISEQDGVYQRQKLPSQLKAFIEKRIQSGRIHENSAREYENWLKSGYLERATQNPKGYHFESCLKLVGASEYRWYEESIVCLNAKSPHKFLRLCRDINEAYEERQRNLALEQTARFAEHNRAMLDVLASVVEFRDAESGQHIQRVRELTMIILRDLCRREPKYSRTKDEISAIAEAAVMHDVGKISIPDAILNKPARLTDEEFEIMKAHTTRGANIIDHLHLTDSPEMQKWCRDIILHHHERYDGKGYPEGLCGDEISLEAQVVGMVDAYDALVSDRCYKKACTHEQALQILQSGGCGELNPMLKQSLISCAAQLRATYNNN